MKNKISEARNLVLDCRWTLTGLSLDSGSLESGKRGGDLKEGN
jgi:hypothetical protein